MKEINAGTDLYFSKNRNSFWVRDVMLIMQLSISRQGDMAVAHLFSNHLKNHRKHLTRIAVTSMAVSLNIVLQKAPLY